MDRLDNRVSSNLRTMEWISAEGRRFGSHTEIQRQGEQKKLKAIIVESELM